MLMQLTSKRFLLLLGLPKFSSELTQRTRTGRTEPTVLFSSGSVQPLGIMVLVLGLGHGHGRRTEVQTSSNRTFFSATKRAQAKVWYMAGIYGYWRVSILMQAS